MEVSDLLKGVEPNRSSKQNEIMNFVDFHCHLDLYPTSRQQSWQPRRLRYTRHRHDDASRLAEKLRTHEKHPVCPRRVVYTPTCRGSS